ncbi:hypothetical protein BT67DRAFT_435306 [Trichocladium antarcticum]|uniref:NWD NACHT-NTPase N-terminal domain-containing protein n=1 Tax=Trichocladium antarcticum TaxID=1450529 RepID=A0AAN6UHA0_9PEZI|nr:hypothetical protein BT67DRAFT_435306 [Trichocladium antarcticum]
MSESRILPGSTQRRDEDGENGRGRRRAERRHRIKSWFATPFNRREGHSSQLGGKGSDSDAWDHDEVAVAIHHASEEFQLKADALQPHQTARASAALKAQDIKNVSTPRISNIPDNGPIGVPRDCWSIARERFIRDDANLWNLFEAVLFKTTVMDVKPDFGSSRPPEEMMREVIKLQLAKINSRRWRLRIPLRSKPAEVRSLVERLAIFAPVTKAAWSTCQLDPVTSGLPLAALLFIGNEKQESEALVKGIAATGDILCLYLLVEGRLMAYEFGELRTKCKEALINLYVAVLRFLANAACHLNRNTAWRIADGATRFSDWEGQLRELEEKRQRFEAFAGALEREATSQLRMTSKA